MADEFLYLVTTGRRTGLPREIEIWFVEHHGAHYIVSGGREKAAWVKNILADGRVRFAVGTGTDHEASLPFRDAAARALETEGDAGLIAGVSRLMTAKYGWSNGLILELGSL